MLGRGVKVSDAAHKWVQEFNRFPQDMIAKLMSIDYEGWREVTTPSQGDSVYLFRIPTEDKDGNKYNGSQREGYIDEVLGDGGYYIVELHDGTLVRVDADELEVQRYDALPMWGTMWQFGDSADDYWLEEMDGIQIMSGCGFRIYESDEWGYFFGIDGAGYDFYEAHWIPLYRKRGLQWHDPTTELTEETVQEMSGRQDNDYYVIRRCRDA